MTGELTIIDIDYYCTGDVLVFRLLLREFVQNTKFACRGDLSGPYFMIIVH